MRLVARVDASVGVEAGGGAEGFAAHVAGVRPLARVRPHVPLQQRRPVEGFAARGTRPGAFLAALLHAAVLAGGGQGCCSYMNKFIFLVI